MSPRSSYYEVIYADPPWSERGGGRIKRGADRHYSLMSESEIISMGEMVRGWSKPSGSFLFLWVTNNHLESGLRVMREWGWSYKFNIVWVKDRFGLGFYVRGQHELLLVGVRGNPPHSRQPVGSSRVGRYIPSSVISSPRREHSRKPLMALEYIHGFSSGPYLELFARGSGGFVTPSGSSKWDIWGEEACLE